MHNAFELKDAQGKPHQYIVIPHGWEDGLDVVDALLNIGLGPIAELMYATAMNSAKETSEAGGAGVDTEALLANFDRKEAVKILSRSEYVGADYEVIANSMTGTFEYEKGDKRPLKDFNVFFRYFATYPYYSDAVWYLTQMRRWGQIPEGKSDSWYHEIAKKVYRPDIYLKAAKLLVDDGVAAKQDFPWDTDGFRAPQSEFIDGITFDGKKPNDYLTKFPIGLKKNQVVVGADVQG